MQSEALWTAVTQGKEKKVWRLDPEGEAERLEATVPWNEAEGFPVNSEGTAATSRYGLKPQGRKEKIKQKWKKR